MSIRFSVLHYLVGYRSRFVFENFKIKTTNESVARIMVTMILYIINYYHHHRRVRYHMSFLLLYYFNEKPIHNTFKRTILWHFVADFDYECHEVESNNYRYIHI